MQSIKLGRTFIMAAALGLFPALALAADKPTADEAKKVIDYYYHGKGLSPVLVETRICHDIQHDGDDKNECAGDVTGQPIKKGDSDYVWMAFMAPNGSDAQPVIVQLELNGAVRWVRNISVSGGLRTRTWLKHTFDKPGAWKLKISLDTGTSVTPLGTMDLNVQE
ncbi:MAG TPA: hypothetical protein VKC56_05045 [Gallionellaceae bacterium]|nr:hypothetical protein [Gallionellaceae bacterium]